MESPEDHADTAGLVIQHVDLSRSYVKPSG
jgi:hypothetical protein